MVFQKQDRFALPPTHQGPPEFVRLKLRVQTYKLSSQSRIHRASAPAAETQAASVPHPDLRPSTSQPRAPRPEDPSCLCLLSQSPSVLTWGGRLGRTHLHWSPRFLSLSGFSTPGPLFCHSSSRPCLLLVWCSRESASLTEPLERNRDQLKHSVQTTSATLLDQNQSLRPRTGHSESSHGDGRGRGRKGARRRTWLLIGQKDRGGGGSLVLNHQCSRAGEPCTAECTLNRGCA